MYIYFDPKNKNQIMAIYSGKPNTKVWEEKGYVMGIIPDNWQPDIDKAIVLNKDKEITKLKDSPRPVPKPAENPLAGKTYSSLTTKQKNAMLIELLQRTGQLDKDGKVK